MSSPYEAGRHVCQVKGNGSRRELEGESAVVPLESMRHSHDARHLQVACKVDDALLLGYHTATAITPLGRTPWGSFTTRALGHLERKELMLDWNCEPRARARDLGLTPGILPTGPLNAISDVQGVRVGHFTIVEGDDIRTGATTILPHGGNLFQDKVPAGVAVGNGYGKLMGSTQIREMGEIETPVVLTNTLAIARAAEAILDWTLAFPGNQDVVSVNPVVGETNDSHLNNMRRKRPTATEIMQAIREADEGPVAEGAVGAGTGTTAFGWKGGIGSSSRRLPEALGGYTVGLLVQSNFGGVLQILGVPVGPQIGRDHLQELLDPVGTDGSIMMILATDAPLSDRNLTRLARRALAGLARTGASMSNGSGDYAISFSTAQAVRRTPSRRNSPSCYVDLPNQAMSPLFLAAIEATEEAIYNSLFVANTVTGYNGLTVPALPVGQVLAMTKLNRQAHRIGCLKY